MTERRISYQSITLAIVIAVALLAFIALRHKDEFIRYFKPEAVAFAPRSATISPGRTCAVSPDKSGRSV